MANDKNKPTELTIDAMQEALCRSGYLLENRLERVLTASKFTCELNAAYSDSATGKSREMDLRAYMVSEPFEGALLWGNLLIECINNSSPVVFITRESGPHDASETRFFGCPEEVDKGNSTVPIGRVIDADCIYSGGVATQYCSFKWKDAKGNDPGMWMAWHDEEQFDAFRKLANEYEFFSKCATEPAYNFEAIELNFYVPVLVLQGEMLQADFPGGELRLQPCRQVKYLKREADPAGQARLYEIDVVTELGFQDFIGNFERRLRSISDALQQDERFVLSQFRKARKESLPITFI